MPYGLLVGLRRIVLRMSDLAVRGKSLEYWFFRFNAGSLAFLVDFIIRRSLSIAEVRVSFWVDGLGRVERLSSPT